MNELNGVLSQPEPEPDRRGAGGPGGRRQITALPHSTPVPRPDAQLETNATQESIKPTAFDWQDILWREWRNTGDEEYAQHLFELLADEPVSGIATSINIFLGLMYGGLVGLLAGLLNKLSNAQIWPSSLPAFVGMGLILGGVIGVALRRMEPRLSWRTWMSRLTLNLAPNELGLVGVGLIFGLFGSQIGWLLGWSAGLGHLIGIMGVSILLAGSLGTKLVGWLAGLGREPNPAYLHQYRPLWFWWRQRPHGFEVEAALQRACKASSAAQKVWSDILHNLARRQQEPMACEKLVDDLQSLNWIDRFMAAHLLAASGGEGVAHLLPLATKITSPLRRTAIRLLRGIEQETTTRLAERAPKLLCPHCLAFCDAHSVLPDEENITYYGCRVCQQSLQFWAGDVVAVLDAAMGSEPLVEAGSTRLNWLTRRELFDFHWVEIVQATDEDVERFAVQVGNDTDPFRQPRYRQMRCLISPTCRLSENTRRILERIFGDVRHVKNRMDER